MKKINILKEQCIGCGACVAIDPEHFNFDDSGKSNAISNENLESSNLLNAIESCPTGAISVGVGSEEETSSSEDSCTDECACHNCNHNCNCDM
jgi:ferredoxin